MGKKIVKLTESDLSKLIKKIIKESEQNTQDIQAVTEVNSVLSSSGEPEVDYNEIVKAGNGDENAHNSLVSQYSTGTPTGDGKINKEGLKQQALNYYCSIKDKGTLKEELKNILRLKNEKKLKEAVDTKDLIYIIGFVIVLLVLLISGRRRGGRYGCPGQGSGLRFSGYR